MIFVLVSVNSIYAAYLTNVPQQLNQPNGTILNCFATGDEFFNWLHDANNYTIIQNDKGWYVFADLLNDELIPTKFIPNIDNPAALGLKPNLMYSEQKLMSMRSKFAIPRKPSLVNKKDEELQSVRNRGVLNNIAIFIRFADESGFTQQLPYFDTPYNAKNQVSVYDYYWNMSYNQLEIKTSFYPQPNGSVILSYQDSYPRTYYKKYNATTAPDGYKNDNERTVREMNLIRNAVEFVKAQIPADFDADIDDDNYIDNVAFIVTGGPEGWADLIWPHMWALYYYDVRINGARVWNFNFLMANWFDSSVLSHEMFHTLGAPDLYRYYTSGSPVGYWDIMSGNLNPPQHMSMFMKYFYGNWIDNLPEVNKSGWYELNPSSTKNSSVIKVQSRYNPDEYFVLEYRKDDGRYDKSLPSDGLLVWRINTKYDGNAGGPPDGVYVYRQDGTASSWGNIAQAPFAAEYGRTKMNDYSTNPKPFLTAGGNGGLNLSDVGTLGQTIKFRLNFPPKSPKLLAPADNNPAVSSSPFFEWEHAENADNYTFQLAEDANFTKNVYSESGILSNYVYLPIQLDFNKKYYWKVTANSNYEEPSATSVTWSINVTPMKPVISRVSAPALLCKDDEMVILVETEGQVMQYQWFRDGAEIKGATQPVLTNKNIDYLYSGEFYCRVTNFPGWDTVYSKIIPVYVVTETDFIQQPLNQTSIVGGNVNFSFKVHVNGEANDDYVSIRWFKNDSLLEDGPRVEGATTDLLSLVNLQEDDFGARFKVEVTGLCGMVIVSDEVTIEKLPNTQTVELSDQFCPDEEIIIPIIMNYFEYQNELSVEIITKPLNIGVQYVEKNGKTYIKFENNIIPELMTVIYKDKASEIEIGKLIHIIIIKSKPVFVIDLPKEITIYKNDMLTLQVSTDNSDLIEWYHNGELFGSLKDVTKYIINSANSDYEGEWQIKLNNECGETWSNICKVTILNTGGVSDVIDYINGINIYPNPVNDIMNITSKEVFDSIEIIDILGNSILKVNTNLVNNFAIDLNQAGLSTGTYFIRINGNNSSKTLRFNILK